MTTETNAITSLFHLRRQVREKSVSYNVRKTAAGSVWNAECRVQSAAKALILFDDVFTMLNFQLAALFEPTAI